MSASPERDQAEDDQLGVQNQEVEEYKDEPLAQVLSRGSINHTAITPADRANAKSCDQLIMRMVDLEVSPEQFV